jgi:hypothetical protein
VVFRILPQEFRAKASAEGPSGNRALPHMTTAKETHRSLSGLAHTTLTTRLKASTEAD